MLTLALATLLACATHDVVDADAGSAAPAAGTSANPAAGTPVAPAPPDPPGTPGPVSDASVEIPGLTEGATAEAAASDAAGSDAAGSDAAPTDAAPASTGSAQGCLVDEDCGSDMICEGQGCGDDQPGTCVPAVRICTKDLRPYCGCDGQTFLSSGSCPGRRYQAAMPCPGDPPPTLPGG